MRIILFLFLILFLTGCTLDAAVVETIVSDTGNIEVYFCPQQDCESELLKFISTAEESLDCALYDIGLESLQDKLLEMNKKVNLRVVTDDHYLHKFEHDFVKADGWGLQHNKFCIVDNKKFFSGSMNPTDNGAHKNNNNLIFIESKVLTANYAAEFAEMWDGEFKKGSPVLNPKVILSDVKVENYFCPEDNCAYHVKEELKKAKESIYFMTFSFTHQGIANILLLKNVDGLDVKGVMEARQVTKYSMFELLKAKGIDVVKDSNPQNMHHKVFIIDGKTVITGSFNPTAGGDTRNDENLLIIEDENIAMMFVEEFEGLTS